MTRIAITGACGRMGRVIAGLVKERADCTIIAGIDKLGERYDEFPVYTKVLNNVPLVLATTGYTDEERAQITAASAQVPVFFTFNMSLGINLLVELARKATQILGGQFDIEIVEKHHNQKKDAPSGTAIMIAEAINEELGGKDHFVYDRHSVRKPRDKDEIGMHAIRGGTIVGEHDIIFAGHDEVITLSHSAQSREVFANGAVNAAVFLAGKPAGMYAMSDLIKEG